METAERAVKFPTSLSDAQNEIELQDGVLRRLREELNSLRGENTDLRQRLSTCEAREVILNGRVSVLDAVAKAARALVRSVRPDLSFDTEIVSEPALTALESALADADLDMTDEELARSFGVGPAALEVGKLEATEVTSQPPNPIRAMLDALLDLVRAEVRQALSEARAQK